MNVTTGNNTDTITITRGLKSLMIPKVVLTGSRGFIGSWVQKQLNLPEENCYDILKNNHPPLGFNWDFTSKAVRKSIVSGADAILHLGAISGIKDCEENPEEARRTNAESTLELAKEAKKAGVKRFIFASTSAVYGETSQYLIDEQHPTNPRCVYGETKLKAEDILKLANDKFKVIIFRKSNVYGFGTRWKGNTVLDQFLGKYLNHEPFEIIGNGAQKRDFVHIQDATRIYCQAVKTGRSGIYNVGGPETISIRGLADLINDIGESIFGYRVPVIFKEGQGGQGWHDFKYDHSKATMEFQYVPRFNLDDAIKERLLLECRK